MRRFFIGLFLFIGLSVQAKDSLPNIILILADDMGYGDARCYNPKSINPTPSIDRLAREGMRFTDAHAPASFCVPTRYGLLTGRYPHRIKLNWRSAALIEEGRTTVPSALREKGYATAMIGKWHLGFKGGPDYDFAKRLVGGPVDHGFDSYFGIPHSLDIVPYYYIRNAKAVQAPTGNIGARNSEGWTRIQGEFWREGPISPDFKHVEVLPRLTGESVKYIKGRKGAKNPFFLYVALPAPHTPWLPTKKFQGKTNNMYSDFVAMVDDTVGQILGALDQAGLTKNTLVVFTSDNGPVWYDTDTRRFGHSATTPLRGMKADAWEAGHRMPFIVRWPGAIKAGAVSDALVCQTDFLATFSALSNRKLADDEGEDSENFLPVLLGQRDRARQELVTGTKPTHMSVRNGYWKYVPSLGSGGFSDPRRIKPVPNGPQGQLYNLADDIGETKNLWLKEPGLVEEFEKQLTKQKVAGRTRPAIELFGKLLREAAQITTQRLDSNNPTGNRFHYYEISKSGRTLKGRGAGRLRKLLLNDIQPATHNEEKMHFDPDVLLRFRMGQHEAQVAVCFCCNKWAMYLDGQTTSYTSFIKQRTEVLAVVKTAFPSDDFIQAIPDKL